MNQLELMRKLSIPGETKMVLMIMDGVGGLPGPDGLTELEAAHTPNLDALAKKGIVGLTTPARPSSTPKPSQPPMGALVSCPCLTTRRPKKSAPVSLWC